MPLPAQAQSAACERTWELVSQLAHDPRDYTQGLVIVDGRLFESTGHYGRSRIVEKDLRSGRERRARMLPAWAFGEGLAQVDGHLLQLTWREGVLFAHALDLSTARSAPWSGQGWGLTVRRDTGGDAELIASDGSDRLRRLDPATLASRGEIRVQFNGRPLDQLNELEMVGAEVLANVWHQTRIVAIDPADGVVRGWYELASLAERFEKPRGWNASENVLNGIAWNEATQTVFVTGKYWPAMFELRLGGCVAAAQAQGP